MRQIGLAVFLLHVFACQEKEVCLIMDGGQMRICNELIGEGDTSLDCSLRRRVESSCFDKLSTLESANFIGTEFSNFRLLAKNKKLRHLGISSPNLDSLDGIDMFPMLEELSISGTNVTDLAPLTQLKELKVLSISETNIQDITPLLEMESLRVLVAVKTKVSCEQLERLRRTNLKVETFVLHPDEYIHFPRSDASEMERKSGKVSEISP